MSIEKFTWRLFDPYGNAMLSAVPYLLIRKVDNNSILDWYDNTFKSSGWTTRSSNLTEVDSVNFPGLYELDLDISLFADGIYQIHADNIGQWIYHDVKEFSVKSGKLQFNVDSDNISKVASRVQGLTDVQSTMLLEIYRLYGLDPTMPLVVTDTARTAGNITQNIINVPSGTTLQRA